MKKQKFSVYTDKQGISHEETIEVDSRVKDYFDKQLTPPQTDKKMTPKQIMEVGKKSFEQFNKDREEYKNQRGKEMSDLLDTEPQIDKTTWEERFDNGFGGVLKPLIARNIKQFIAELLKEEREKAK